MRRRFEKLIVTVLMAGALLAITSASSYAAGFYNYTYFTLQFHFTSESCPWALRWACGEVYTISPIQNGRPGHMSSNNTAGTIEVGGDINNLLTDERVGRVYYSQVTRTIEVGKQDWIDFHLEGNVLKARIHRSDTGRVEVEEVPIANLRSGT